MSAHVLLNLSNELKKIDKMQGLPSILSLFRNKFNKFNNTGARMLDSIYHMTLKLLKSCIFGIKNVKILSSFTQRNNGRHYTMLLNLVYRIYCTALYHSQMQRYMINSFKRN